MRGALILNHVNQSEIDKSKPTNLKSALIFSFQRCLRLLTWLILHFPSLVGMWVHAMELYYPATFVQGNRKNVEGRGSCR